LKNFEKDKNGVKGQRRGFLAAKKTVELLHAIHG
jgi:hypothetical protein